jgi:hypothetical protein
MAAAGQWCILRTKQRDTLRLADSLAEDGLEAWAPRMTEMVEPKHGKGPKREVVRAMLPGFVFAAGSYVVDLLDLASMPVKPRRGAGLLKPAHKGFSLLRTTDRIHFVDEPALAELRSVEQRASGAFQRAMLRAQKPVWAQRAFLKGERVRAGRDVSGFEGMCGIVVESTCRATVVCFDAWFNRVEIPTSLLKEDAAYELQYATDSAVREAA